MVLQRGVLLGGGGGGGVLIRNPYFPNYHNAIGTMGYHFRTVLFTVSFFHCKD